MNFHESKTVTTFILTVACISLPTMGFAQTNPSSLVEVITIERQPKRCEVLLLNSPQNVPGHAGLTWLSMFEPLFVSLHKEVTDALEDPAHSPLGIGQLHKLTPDFKLIDVRDEIDKAINSISHYEDPQIYFYLDSHGEKNGSTCLLYDGSVHNSKVLDIILRPILDFVSKGKVLTLNLMVNTCYAGAYIDGVKALVSSHRLPKNLTINVMTAVPNDMKAHGNLMFKEIQAAQRLLSIQTSQQFSRVCSTCSNFQRIALVTNRVTWASSQFPGSYAKGNNQFWSTQRAFDEFNLEEILSLLKASSVRLKQLFPRTEDKVPIQTFEGSLNIWLRLAQLTVDGSRGLSNEKRLEIIKLLQNQIAIVKHGEEILSRARVQRSIWYRWSTEIEKLIDGM